MSTPSGSLLVAALACSVCAKAEDTAQIMRATEAVLVQNPADRAISERNSRRDALASSLTGRIVAGMDLPREDLAKLRNILVETAVRADRLRMDAAESRDSMDPMAAMRANQAAEQEGEPIRNCSAWDGYRAYQAARSIAATSRGIELKFGHIFTDAGAGLTERQWMDWGSPDQTTGSALQAAPGESAELRSGAFAREGGPHVARTGIQSARLTADRPPQGLLHRPGGRTGQSSILCSSV